MYCLQLKNKALRGSINLPSSKSISNRLLILNELWGHDLQLSHLSEAEDTVVLQKALQNIKSHRKAIIDIGHAGTNFRFLTALLALTPGEWTLTGSERLQQRPIRELVEALQELGADITYLKNEFCAPLLIKGNILKGGKITIKSSVSSQFISALVMVAPLLENGLSVQLEGEVVSRPYIDMTIKLMQSTGLSIERKGSNINVFEKKNPLREKAFVVESDWSAASYWYAFVALSQSGRVELKGLQQNSLQGDAVLEELFLKFGVTTRFTPNGVLLEKQETNAPTVFEYDFTDCPDIAQTLMLVCAALGVEAKLTGLSTLKGKESNRLEAMQIELAKLSIRAELGENTFYLPAQHKVAFPEEVIFDTYNDHRMAMCLAPIALLVEKICFREHEVVKKSYPRFWSDMESVFS
jgi:3-phosphoshikimate 1-carboxyvinyltransferase